ncbi:hypothetical protein GXP67_06620 [Rhodocytophaga rosea]|uniref:Uncharacterized protein n=1 Tax=Rhodocytophaga rosea TaxID=2704465 RepID=A0A6C0GEW5_9BACT|nr:hypothetical protein [Rhodocytophaga rosea]QHT66354.1 hypothetical protein GXP67_06620 [Rhodocytophaga rosea]
MDPNAGFVAGPDLTPISAQLSVQKNFYSGDSLQRHIRAYNQQFAPCISYG